MKQTIYLDAEGRQTLVKKFGVTATTVSYCLRFKQNNLLASKMRSYAVNHLNGILITV